MDKRIGKRVKNDRISAQVKISLDNLFERFIQAKTAEGRAKGTLEQYKLNYGFFTKFLDNRGIERIVHHVTTELIRDYIVWMMNEKVRFDGHHFVPDYAKSL